MKVSRIQFGMTLTELMITLLLSSLLSLASIEWFIGISRLTMTQQHHISASEVGRFSTSYLNKLAKRSGAGLADSASIVEEDKALVIRYSRQLPVIGSVRNCLGNKPKSSIVEDRIETQPYIYGGFELKCVSSGLGDWLTEGIQSVQYQIAVDQGRMESETFIWGEYDSIPDAFIPLSSFDSDSMNPVAISIELQAYRPLKVMPFSSKYWHGDMNSALRQNFFSYVSLSH